MQGEFSIFPFRGILAKQLNCLLKPLHMVVCSEFFQYWSHLVHSAACILPNAVHQAKTNGSVQLFQYSSWPRKRTPVPLEQNCTVRVGWGGPGDFVPFVLGLTLTKFTHEKSRRTSLVVNSHSTFRSQCACYWGGLSLRGGANQAGHRHPHRRIT